MRDMLRYIIVVGVVLLGFATQVEAQNMPERGLVRKGNKLYNREL